ncbi:hypothetical protein JOC36_000736 [Weissella uvarum]|uniref:hypothetical protein n=1 Tax=Weissella uvarum TaxID=1479233 RepID=UPI00195FD929|nr:hypothetical protein [Weissella uvarum]MBM7617187.1 hypothetical protein [Weissella uvarum]MCM0595481.1 hypothetical protein [Weissella uvarum]
MTERQATKFYAGPNGLISKDVYTQQELMKLTDLLHGSEFVGITSTDSLMDYRYVLGGRPITSLVGADGVLQIYNNSTFVSDTIVQHAADFINALAGVEVVQVVKDKSQADEWVSDAIVADNGALAAQTYNGDGILMYPNSWRVSQFNDQQLQNIKVAVLVHELLHAMGVTHLTGGYLGENGNKRGIGTDERDGFSYGKLQAAALAAAATSWECPRRVADWAVKDGDFKVAYKEGKITTDIPDSCGRTFQNKPITQGLAIDSLDNILGDEHTITFPIRINQNYNVYAFKQTSILEKAAYVNTTKNFGWIDQVLEGQAMYQSTKGLYYYKVKFDGESYLINSGAVDSHVNYIDNAMVKTMEDDYRQLKMVKKANKYIFNEEWYRAPIKTNAELDGDNAELVNRIVNIEQRLDTVNGPYYKIFYNHKNYVIHADAFEKKVLINNELVTEKSKITNQSFIVVDNQMLYQLKDDGYSESATLVGTTSNMNLIGQKFVVTQKYITESKKVYYRIGDYIVSENALMIDDGMGNMVIIDGDRIITPGQKISKTVEIVNNYNVYQFNEQAGIVIANMVGMTLSKKIVGEKFTATTKYVTEKNREYYRVGDYVIQPGAFKFL